MRYQGKTIEVIGEKTVLGQQVSWIRVLENDEFLEVPSAALEADPMGFSMESIRFIVLATKIKAEVAQKNILAPYESSLVPLPHQILVLEKVMQSAQNRFLLADEVGMGKTIEAGLIMKELKLRGDIKRTLVIVPKSAMTQWQSELKEHFNEAFHLYDSQLISALAKTFGKFNADEEFNFWQQHNQIIVSTDALKPMERRQGWSQEKIDEYNKFRIQAVLNANFDLVVIDEVHKMGGGTATVARYQLAQALCNVVPNVLLLSATPHRGKSDHFRRILQLLDPDAFSGEGLPPLDELEPYVIRTEKRLAVDYEGKKLFNQRQTLRLEVKLDPIKHAYQLALYEAVTTYVRQGFNAAVKTQNTAVGLIMVLFQRLASSSTAAILSAMRGRLTRLQAGEEEILEAYTDDWDLGPEAEELSMEMENLFPHFTGSITDEVGLLTDLVTQAEDCLRFEKDAKAHALVEKIKELQLTYNNPRLKVLVFTEFRSTQAMLKQLLEQEGFSCEQINGSQDLETRRNALGRFKHHAQLMIATDAAGESLNMQFCHLVFNYDLPWNPMMIEQRIGRVDRIGQQQAVLAFNMLTNNSVDQRVYQVIEEKLAAILQQLGIDKTSDVLDSTLDPQQVNQLYLQSLLDPSKFEFTGKRWLREIREKLRNYQATEGILPQVKEQEIQSHKAAEIKHSPLPVWLKDMVYQHVLSQHGQAEESSAGIHTIQLSGHKLKASFEPLAAMNDPEVEHLSLQHDFVKTLLTSVGEFAATQGLPVIQAKEGEETSGTWSLWQIYAQGSNEKKVRYQANFVSDTGKIFAAYANDIWNRLIADNQQFEYIHYLDPIETEKYLNQQKKVLDQQLLNTYKELEAQLEDSLQRRFANRQKSYEFQRARIGRIGIENIRDAKLQRLELAHQIWLSEFQRDKAIIPGIRHLISIRIDG